MVECSRVKWRQVEPSRAMVQYELSRIKYTTVRWKYSVPTEGKIKDKYIYIYIQRESIKQNIKLNKSK